MSLILQIESTEFATIFKRLFEWAIIRLLKFEFINLTKTNIEYIEKKKNSIIKNNYFLRDISKLNYEILQIISTNIL